MTRVLFTAALVGATFGLTACGGSEVAIQARLEAEQEAPAIVLRDLPVRLLPYDRDALFDSLQAAYPTPQPEIPEELLQLESQISDAQAAWQNAEERWITVRDSLQRLSNAMRGMNQRSGEYLLMYRDFQALEGQESALKRQQDQAFSRFTELQSRYTTQADEIRVARENWADEAYAPIDSIIRARLREMRREEVWDTLGSEGTGRVSVPAGRWWVHAVYALPYYELYWNVPVEVPRGEQVEVQLTRQNAMVRPRL
jgi:hypothetical protein